MALRSLHVAFLFGVLTTGCLARGGAAGASAPDQEVDEDDAGPVPVTAMANSQVGPGQQEVAWEDNGVPIRQLTGPGKPQEMKLPENRPKLVDLKKKPAAPQK